MSESKKSRKEEAVDTRRDKETMRQFADARLLLKRHLVHTRDMMNGRDFLFLGPTAEIHNALKLVVETEQKSGRFIHLDFAQVDEYFLLRVLGAEADQLLFSKYFE